MRIPSLIALFVFPILAVAQNTTQGTPAQSGTTPAASGGGQNSNATTNVIVTTSFSTGVTLGQGRVESTFTTGIVLTITPPQPTQTSGNNTNTGSNNTSSASSSTSTGPLPTAPTDINGGGGGPGKAPFPGQSAAGGVFGPPDDYISWAESIPINSLLSLIAGVGIGGVMVLA